MSSPSVLLHTCLLASLFMPAEQGTAQENRNELLKFVVPQIEEESDEQDTHERLEAAVDQLQQFTAENYRAETATGWGRRFSPLGTVGMRGTGGNTTHEGFRVLVSSGSDAVTILVKHLDDDRPSRTQISETVRQWDNVAKVYEIFGNSLNRFEANQIWNKGESSYLRSAAEFEAVSKGNSLRVGDLCAMALGQIVSRDYAPVRPLMHFKGQRFYFPFSESLLLQGKLKSSWSECADRQQLLTSLLIDFHTRDLRATYDEQFDEYNSQSSELVCNATLRLLYYFPDSGARVVADEIDEIQGDRFYSRGIDAADLVRCTEPFKYDALETAIQELGRRATDTALLSAVRDVLESR